MIQFNEMENIKLTCFCFNFVLIKATIKCVVVPPKLPFQCPQVLANLID